MRCKLLLILIFVFLLANSAFAQERMVAVTLNLAQDSITAEEIELYEGEAMDYAMDYDEMYTANVYSFNGDSLYSFNFEKSFAVYDAEVEELPDVEELVSFPYYNNMKRMEILDGREVMLDLDLSGYATCNEDSICDPLENEENCQQDCVAKSIVADEVLEEAPVEDAQEEVVKEKQKFPLVYIVAIVLVVLLITILLIRKRKQ